MNKVVVLLSTYNGSKYVVEQINSVLNQEEVEVNIIIRDDASTDNTVQIIKHNFSNDSRINLIEGKNNYGYKKSFFTLIQYIKTVNIDFDFVSFCDQDDFWESTKIISAVNKLNEFSKGKPVCYSSNLKVVDQMLNFNKYMYSCDPKPTNIKRSIINGYAYGCTIVINKKAYNLIQKFDFRDNYAFDFYIPIICNIFGDSIYDDKAYILYRQHSSNVIGANRNIRKQLNYSLTKYSTNFYSKFAAELISQYPEMPGNCKNILNQISGYQNSIYSKVILVFDKNICKMTIKGTFLLKFMILFSKF